MVNRLIAKLNLNTVKRTNTNTTYIALSFIFFVSISTKKRKETASALNIHLAYHTIENGRIVDVWNALTEGMVTGIDDANVKILDA